MELLVLHWPFLVGAAGAAALLRGHRWLVVGLIGAGLVVGYGLALASEQGFIFSDQDLFVFLGIYWGATWLLGVLVGTVVASLRGARARGTQ